VIIHGEHESEWGVNGRGLFRNYPDIHLEGRNPRKNRESNPVAFGCAAGCITVVRPTHLYDRELSAVLWLGLQGSEESLQLSPFGPFFMSTDSFLVTFVKWF
jgi:hypothetical protein